MRSQRACREARYIRNMDANTLLEALRGGQLDRRQVQSPEAAAVIEFCEWLTFPTELGRLPDAIEVVDQRILPWPPERTPRQMWLLSAVARDEAGLSPDEEMVGLVGSTTFCFFDRALPERPPEDVYALYAAWELEQQGLIAWDPATGGALDDTPLSQWKGGQMRAASHEGDLKLSVRVRRTRTVLSVASGENEGVRGWLVLDADDSRWYPANEQPRDTTPADIARLHLCRQLLGFQIQPDRWRYLRPARVPLPDLELIERYERALDVARKARGEEQEERFSNWNPLQRWLHPHVGALVRAGRAADVAKLIEELAPFWNHNLGYAELGKAAHAAGLDARAEALFQKLIQSYPHAYRSEAMGLLADIWCRQGRAHEAWTLLSDAVLKTAADSPQGLPAEMLERHKEDLRRLFPDRAEAFLRTVESS